MNHQLGSRRRVDFSTAYKVLRNQLRRYNAVSIVEAALRVLWAPGANPLEKLRAAPWQTLLLVKWALQDQMVELSNAPAISQQNFDALRQRLWSIGEWADVQTAGGQLFMRQLLHAQVEFQRKPTFSFMRQAALIARLPVGHALSQKFKELFGFGPNEYLDLAFATYAAILDEKRILSKGWFSPLEPLYGATTITLFLTHIARDLPSLRHELRRPAGQRPTPSELYEFPAIKRYPLLSRTDGSYECWHPMVFNRGLEELVHYKFAPLGTWYAERYSQVFESYVIELLQESGLQYLDEDALKELVGANSSVPDAAICIADCNVFVEAKMGLFADAFFVEGDPEHLRNRTKAVRKAIKQGWEISGALRDGRCSHSPFSKAKQDFLIVVTNRELNLSRGELLSSMYSAVDEIRYPSPQAQQFLPLTNVFFVSIDDFERLVGGLRAGDFEMVTLLKEAVLANLDPHTSTYYFGDHLTRNGGVWPQSGLISKAMEESAARLHCIEN